MPAISIDDEATRMTVAASLIFFGIVCLVFSVIAAIIAICHKAQANDSSTALPSSSSSSQTLLSSRLSRKYSSGSVYTVASSSSPPHSAGAHTLPLAHHPSSTSLLLLSPTAAPHASYGSTASRKNSFSTHSASSPTASSNMYGDANPHRGFIKKAFSSTALGAFGRGNYNSDLSTPTPPDSDGWSPFEFSSVGYGIFAQDDPVTNDSKFNYLKSDFGLVLYGGWNALDVKLKQLQDEADRVYRNSNRSVQSKYKVLFVARHGQGYHNLAIEIYGQAAWDSHWSKLDGDGNIVWGPDPDLTPLGVEQARRNNIAWKRQILTKSAPVPAAFFVSPFTRASDTMIYTWADISRADENNPTNNYYTGHGHGHHRRKSNSNISIYALDDAALKGSASNSNSSISTKASIDTEIQLQQQQHSAQQQPPPDKTSLANTALIVEDLRETIGVHTCDMRSTKTQVHQRHPTLAFEPGFSEDDTLWTPDYRETSDEQNARLHRFLERLFSASHLYRGALLPETGNNVSNGHSASANTSPQLTMHGSGAPPSTLDDAKYVSITAHSGTINSILKVTNHRPFNVQPGGMIPVIVKATRYRRTPETSLKI